MNDTPPAKERKIQTSVYLPESLLRALQRIAFKNNRSLTQQCEVYLAEMVSRAPAVSRKGTAK